MKCRVLFSLVLATLSLHAFAAPDLTGADQAGSLTVIPDDKRSGLYYYPPGDLRLATESDGQPSLRLLLLRYMGTHATGDQGSALFRSLLTVRIIMDGPDSTEIEEARQALAAGNPRRRIELRPLPVERIEAALVYAPVGGDESILPEGYFEATAEGGVQNRGTYWKERTYTVRLSPNDAQLVWTALHEQQVLFSLGYAFFAAGLAPETPLAVLTGSPTLVKEIEDSLDQNGNSTDTDESGESLSLVKAGATSIVTDVSRWPGVAQRIDINEKLPPGYPLLEIRCYDFRDHLRPNLELKKVEVEAVGVAGKPVMGQALFERIQPDLYTQSLRLPFAVRMDKPYRYRVTEIGSDGGVVRGAWQEMASWAHLLDVTTPASEFEKDDPNLVEEKQ